MLSRRFQKSISWALRHLLLSLVIAIIVAILVIGYWFPAPFWQISGGLTLFLTIVAVDIVCGPILTLLLLHSEKSRKALLTDLLFIITIQISALLYGFYTLSEGRPVAMVFEVDRFHVISFADLDISRPESIPDWIENWSGGGPRILGTRNAKNSVEKIESVDASLQGVEPGQRPWWWQDYVLSAPQVKDRAKPLPMLLAMHPEMVSRIKADAAKAVKSPREHETANAMELLWLPVVSRQVTDWVAFIDPQSARIRGYSNVDGFGE